MRQAHEKRQEQLAMPSKEAIKFFNVLLASPQSWVSVTTCSIDKASIMAWEYKYGEMISVRELRLAFSDWEIDEDENRIYFRFPNNGLPVPPPPSNCGEYSESI